MSQPFQFHHFFGAFITVISIAVIACIGISVISPVQAQRLHIAATVPCALTPGNVYRSPVITTVFYITPDCQKRPIFNPSVYFSYYEDWSPVIFVEQPRIDAVSNHPLHFMPWGPRRTFQNNSLIKTTDDPHVFLIEDGKAYPFGSEEAFKAFGFTFDQIEDVSQDSMEKFQKQTDEILNLDQIPPLTAFKYLDVPEVYILANEQGSLRKRHVTSMDELKTMYRADRIATFPKTKTFEDTTWSPSTSSPEASGDPSVPLAFSFNLTEATTTISGLFNLQIIPTNNARITSVQYLFGSKTLETITSAPYIYSLNTNAYINEPNTVTAIVTGAQHETKTVVRNVIVKNLVAGGGSSGGSSGSSGGSSGGSGTGGNQVPSDTTPPVVTTFSVPTSSVSMTVSVSAFVATDAVGVTGYLLTETAGVPSASAQGWSSSVPASYTFSSVGSKMLFAWAKDSAGNISQSLFATVSVVNATPPVLSSVASSTTMSSATITWTTDKASTSTVEYGATTSYGSSLSVQTATTSHRVSVTGLASSATYHFRIISQDEYGNVVVSSDYTLRTSATPDTTPPVISSVTSSTTATTATITWTTDEPSTSLVNYGVSSPAGSTSYSAALVTSHTIVLTGLTANAVFHFRVTSVDASGNQSQSGDLTGRTIVVADTTPPTVSLTTPTNNATISGSSVSLQATATDDIAISSVTFKWDGSILLADTQSPYVATLNSTLYANGSHTLEAVASDLSGNLATSSIVVTVSNAVADVVAPIVTSFAIPSVSNTRTVSITSFTASDAIGVTGYQVTESSSAPLAGATGWSASAPTSYGFISDGLKTLYAWAKDAAGNVSLSSSASVTIDTIAPTAVWTSPVSGASVSGTVLLTVSASDSFSVASVSFWVDGSYYSLDSSSPYAASLNTVSYNNGSHALRAVVTDGVGNASEASITVNVQNSQSGSLVISSIASSTSETTATITWVTDQASTSQVDFSLQEVGYATSTGGIITTDETYWIHTFTTSGTFIPSDAMLVDALVVGGGGAGGSDPAERGGGGGGGGGGVQYVADHAVTAKTYAIIVGSGGFANGTNGGAGGHGATSTFDTISSDGGGGGGNTDRGNGAKGASGGGGAGEGGAIGGLGRSGQGYAGASDQTTAGGGGGGAGAAATNQNGGNGAAHWISGMTQYYGAGGGGAGDGDTGSGGNGGGGNGSTGSLGGDGVANTGGGGGGAGADGGNARGGSGGSGVVIIRYPKSLRVASSTLVTNHSIVLDGLTPDTLYHYRVSSQNASGLSTSSTGYTFRTQSDRTPPVISAVTSTAYQTSVTIDWTTDEQASSTIDFGTSIAYGSQATSSEFTTSHSISIYGLNTSTTYHFRVRSTDQNGNTSTTDDYTFITSDTGSVNLAILPSDRRTVWNPGLNAVGGIPNYTSIYATLSPSGGSDTAAIQSALNAAGAVATKNSPKVVYLNAGVYTISGEGLSVPSYVVLRGAGPDSTKLVRDFKGNGVDVKVKIVNGGLGGSQTGQNVATFVYSVDGGATYTTNPQTITFYGGWDVKTSPLMRITFATGDGTNGFGGVTYTAGDVFTIHWDDSIAPFGDWRITHTGNGYSGLELDNYGDPYSVVSIGNSGWADFGSAVNLTSDAVKDSNYITVSNASGFTAGDLVHLDELNEIAVGRVWLSEPANEWFSRMNRNVTQRLEIDHIVNNTIYFTTPFHTNFRVSQSAQISKVLHPVRYAGVEDLYAYGGSGGDGGGNFNIVNGMYSWIKHVEAERSGGAGAGLSGSFRSVIRDSYIHTAAKIYPGSSEYMVCVDSGSSDNLVENNIMWEAGKATVMRTSGGGNVIAYNYMDDIFISDPYYVGFIESGMNASHQTTPHFELFEGNQSFNFDADTTHGNSFNIVAFRNHMTGLRRSSMRPLPTYGTVTSVDNHTGYAPRSIEMSDKGPRATVRPTAYDYNFSFIGNVLGYSGMPLSIPGTETQQTRAMYDMEGDDIQDDVFGIWMLGNAGGGNWQTPPDPNVINSTLRDGNFDYVTNEQRWHGIGRGTAPYSEPSNYVMPDSLYLTGKPSFFGSYAWPWVTPEETMKTQILPARARFDAGTPNEVQ